MHQYNPRQIDAIESFREAPYCSMCGCHETEMVVKAVVQWLLANGNRWDIHLPPLETLTAERNIKHSHGMYDDNDDCSIVRCDFRQNYVIDGMVNEKFIERVHRGNDGMRLTKAALRTLRPDIFQE